MSIYILQISYDLLTPELWAFSSSESSEFSGMAKSTVSSISCGTELTGDERMELKCIIETYKILKCIMPQKVGNWPFRYYVSSKGGRGAWDLLIFAYKGKGGVQND
jgi:hypothetical protein